MTDSAPLSITVLLTPHNQCKTLDFVLNSICSQDYSRVECVVIDAGSTDGSKEILARHRDQIAWLETAAAPDIPNALKRAIEQTPGDILMWMDAGQALCPWACRVVASVMTHCPSVEWLTSSAPLEWTPHAMLVQSEPVDGFSRKAFFAGRNLKTSPYYHHAISRAATFWRRALWECSGSRIRAPLIDAGDFELWMRFWDCAELASIALPLAGSCVAEPNEDAGYWNAAQNWWRARPLRQPLWQTRVRQRIVRYLPRLAARWGSPATVVTLGADATRCTVQSRYIL